MKATGVETATRNWNVVSGCQHGCWYCYVKRLGLDMTPKFHAELLEEPFKEKVPQKIFVSNTGDLFGQWVPKDWIKTVLDVVERCPQHTFQFYTKNPKGMIGIKFPANCWTGVSVGTCDDVLMKLPLLCMIDSPLKFVSVEPILDFVTFSQDTLDRIKWVIIGARTDRNAHTGADPRKAQEYARKLVKQLKEAKIPFWIKDSMKWSPSWSGAHGEPFPTNKDFPFPKEEQGVLL